MSKWQEKCLEKIADIRVSNVDKKIYPSKSLVGLCNYMDVYSKDYISNKNEFSIGSADSNEIQRFGLRMDDVIITKDSETPDDIAVSAVVIEELENVVCGYHLAILRPDKNEVDGKYLMLYFKSNDLKSYFFGVAKGSTRFGLTIGDIEKAIVKFPSLPKQRLIAKIISTVDGVIEKTHAAIAKYKAIKQGMLQDLFTRGIDIDTKQLRPQYVHAPHLYKKSKLGWVPKDWEIKAVSSAVDIISGGTPSTHVNEYWNGEIPWLSVEDFNTGNRYVSTALKKITLEGLNNSATNLLLPGMIIISARGTVGAIAQIGRPMAFNQSCYGLHSTDSNLANDFFYYFLIYYRDNFGFNSFGSVFNTITKDYFDKMETPVIRNSNEQELITARLSTIDKKIESEQLYLQKQYQIKVGLMNDLLSGKKEVIVNKELVNG